MALTIATWNVNSLKVRLPHLVDWLAKHSPDVVALQETKTEDDSFPYDELAAAGEHGPHRRREMVYGGVDHGPDDRATRRR